MEYVYLALSIASALLVASMLATFIGALLVPKLTTMYIKYVNKIFYDEEETRIKKEEDL